MGQKRKTHTHIIRHTLHTYIQHTHENNIWPPIPCFLFILLFLRSHNIQATFDDPFDSTPLILLKYKERGSGGAQYCAPPGVPVERESIGATGYYCFLGVGECMSSMIVSFFFKKRRTVFTGGRGVLLRHPSPLWERYSYLRTPRHIQYFFATIRIYNNNNEERTLLTIRSRYH